MTNENPQTIRTVVAVTAIFIIVLLVILVILTFILARRARLATNSNPCGTPAPPINVTTSTINLGVIQVNWAAVPNAVRYRVYLGSISGFTQANPLDTFNTTQTNFSITRQTLNRTYFVRVSSINQCGAESILSAETRVTLGLPRKFLIVSRANPNLALTVGPDFESIVLDNRCSGGINDNLCVWQYDPENGFIQSVGTPLNCMKTFPATVDLRVKYGSCSVLPYYNSAAARQWNFDPTSGSLCNPQNPEGLNCVRINDPLIAGQSTVRVPFDDSTNMRFDIVSFQEPPTRQPTTNQ
jgi:hypothetical protein